MKIKNINKEIKEKFKIPHSTQQAIPIKGIYEDGIFLTDTNEFSKCYKFSDINYAVAGKEEKEIIFLNYSEVLNSLDTGANSKITIINRKLNKLDFEKTMEIPLKQDNLDNLRAEYNKMLLDKTKGANGIIQEKYITISIKKKTIEEARAYFSRIGIELQNHFSRLHSTCIGLDLKERMRIFHSFYRAGEEDSFFFDLKETMKKRHGIKDYISPDSMKFEKDYFKIGNRYGRILFLKEYANYIRDSMISEISDTCKSMMLSIDLTPIPMDEAVKLAEKIRLGVETNITNWQRRQNANNNFTAIIPYDLEQQRAQSKEFLDDLITRDQKMFLATITMVHIADTKEQLDNDTESILSTVQKNLCQFGILRYQQMDGLNTVLPIGTRNIDNLRTLTTESLAVFMPFRAQELQHSNGVYYGQNPISRNMITVDKKKLINGNSFVLGVSGSGKSFLAKQELSTIYLREPDADIIIIDPEAEYSPLVNALGGETIKISATSNNHINALDINSEYKDDESEDPIKLKSEFILSLCEQIMGTEKIGANQRSVIDRCTAQVYRYYLQGNYKGIPPTLQDFRAELLKQPEPEAKDIALAIELFVEGSLNTFAEQTNVDIKNRLICYDIIDLGEQLQTIGMLVILDSIFNRISANRTKGKSTYIYIDEIYLLLQHNYSAKFLARLWKRIRKYGGYATGITQNIEDMLQSNTARNIIANSEFLVMLNQAGTDIKELGELLKLSEDTKKYITNVPEGRGLLKVGKSYIPFENEFPKDTNLYKLMTTKPGEVKI